VDTGGRRSAHLKLVTLSLEEVWILEGEGELTCSLLPSLLRKCGYWREKVSSSSVSSSPLAGSGISWDLETVLNV